MAGHTDSQKFKLPGINELFSEHLWETFQQTDSSSSRPYSVARYTQKPIYDDTISHPSAQSESTRPYSPDEPNMNSLPPMTRRVHASPTEAMVAFRPADHCYSSFYNPNEQFSHSTNADSLQRDKRALNLKSESAPRTSSSRLYSGYAKPQDSDDSFKASITTPTFRVTLPPLPTINGFVPSPSERRSGASALSGVRETQSGHPPNYLINSYMPGPTVPGNPHSMAMQQNHGVTSAQGPNVDEKRHRCPHCNKRFNRPSSLIIHVNTHTGAKPFVCIYPGCNRRFNVNSNMRRHYRNHLTPKRSDVVSRFLPPPSPSLSTSTSTTLAGESPVSSFSTNLPSVGSRRYSSASARSFSPASSGSSGSDGEGDTQSSAPHQSFRRRQTVSELSRETQNLSIQGHSESSTRFEHDRCRMRSISSPVRHSRPGEEQARPQTSGSSCNVPGCRGCHEAGISTALRPAFPENR